LRCVLASCYWHRVTAPVMAAGRVRRVWPHAGAAFSRV
jgi:hypothetical protein